MLLAEQYLQSNQVRIIYQCTNSTQSYSDVVLCRSHFYVQFSIASLLTVCTVVQFDSSYIDDRYSCLDLAVLRHQKQYSHFLLPTLSFWQISLLENDLVGAIASRHCNTLWCGVGRCWRWWWIDLLSDAPSLSNTTTYDDDETTTSSLMFHHVVWCVE